MTATMSSSYEELISAFGEDKIVNRYKTIYEYLSSFIERYKYQDYVVISTDVLNQAIVDYFADILRLKQFHGIERINFLKIHAYSAYWILRRKPLQIIKDNEEDPNLAFVNEEFVASYLIRFLVGKDESATIPEELRGDYIDFVQNLKYSLRYRAINAQSLESILCAYNGGRVFEKALL